MTGSDSADKASEHSIMTDVPTVEQIQHNVANGDILEAYDLTEKALRAYPEDKLLAFWKARCLTELGQCEAAIAYFESNNMLESGLPKVETLYGRMLKERAFNLGPDHSQFFEIMRQAAHQYAATHHSAPDSFAAVNAATLHYLAGEDEEARKFAQEAEQLSLQEGPSYWQAVTLAEVALLLGQYDDVLNHMSHAGSYKDIPPAYFASTIRQFKRLRDVGCGGNAGQNPDFCTAIDSGLARLQQDPVLVYCGHMFRSDGQAEATLRKHVDAVLDNLQCRISFGPLACGADIVIAEALLDRGAELNLVFPFAIKDFREVSVRCGGDEWISRFERCLEKADSVVFATAARYVGDDNQFAYSTRVAMGLAITRARYLFAEAVQLAVVNDQTNKALGRGSKVAGTRADIAEWEAIGGKTVIVPAGEVDRNLVFPEAPKPFSGTERLRRSIIFADYAGFSGLDERQLPLFVQHVMGRIGEVLNRYGDQVLYRNSWGDAIYAVIEDPIVAANIAIDLQLGLQGSAELLGGLNVGEEKKRRGMRIGLHHGPLFKGRDAITELDLYYGTEVTRTARIEPVTPTNSIYCTEAFVAMLAMEDAPELNCHYVGRVALAKNYGDLSLFRLERRAIRKEAG